MNVKVKPGTETSHPKALNTMFITGETTGLKSEIPQKPKTADEDKRQGGAD